MGRMMLELLGVIGSNGVPVLIRASENMIKKDVIVYLVSCLNAISELIGKGETKILDIEDYKLLIVDSNKGYTIIGLSRGPIEETQILLQAIRDEIDEGDVPKFRDVVTEDIEKRVSNIVDKQLSLLHPLILLQKIPEDVENRMSMSDAKHILRENVINYILSDFPKNLIVVMRTIKNIYRRAVVKYLGKHIGRILWNNMTNMLQPGSMKDLRPIFSEFSVIGRLTRDSIGLIVCPECIARRSTHPICTFLEGLIEGMFNNPRYQIMETKCIAAGDKECLFVIKETR